MRVSDFYQNNVSHKGITRVLKKNPFIYNEVTAPVMNGEKLVGKIPPDFLKLLKKNDVRQAFSGIDSTISNSFGTFSFLESYINTRIKSYVNKLSFPQFIRFSIEQIKYLCHGKSIYDRNFLFHSIGLDENFIKTTEKTLTNDLKKGFVQSKLINEDDTLAVELHDFGGFGTIYKMSCTDKNNNKVFTDKVIKFYRNKEEKDSINTEIELLNYRMIKSHKIIVGLVSKLLNIAFVKTGILDKKIFNKIIGEKLAQIEACPTAADYKNIVTNQEEKKNRNIYKKYHGVYREANIALYIQKNIGHRLKNSDAIDFYFSNPKYQYSVFEFSDKDTLGEVRKHNIISDLGIRTNDTEFNNRKKNYVADRLIDYGDFKPINKTLIDSKVARRYYKKIKNVSGKGEDKYIAQMLLLSHYYSLALNNKIPNSKEVLAGLNEALSLLPEKYRILVP